MTLVVDELYDGVTFTQNFRIQRSMQLAHFRPWIYKQGTLVDGDFTLQILQDAVVLKEVSINYVDINAELTATYSHGQLRFDTEPLQLNHDREAEYTEYQVKLFMANHTTDNQNFMSLVRRYEQKFYRTYGDGVVDGEAPNDMVEPLGFELFEYTY
jgi:hypothetical protein